MFDAAAVEPVDRLELVERDDDARLAQIAEAPWQRKYLGRQARDVAVAPDARELHRHAHRARWSRPRAAAPALRAADRLLEPAARLVPARLHREQRSRVAFEKGEIGAVAADRDFGGQRAAAADGAQRLADQGRLAVAPRGDEEDFLAGGQIAHEPVQLVDAIDERRRGHDLAVHEWVFHYVKST